MFVLIIAAIWLKAAQACKSSALCEIPDPPEYKKLPLDDQMNIFKATNKPFAAAVEENSTSILEYLLQNHKILGRHITKQVQFLVALKPQHCPLEYTCDRPFVDMLLYVVEELSRTTHFHKFKLLMEAEMAAATGTSAEHYYSATNVNICGRIEDAVWMNHLYVERQEANNLLENLGMPYRVPVYNEDEIAKECGLKPINYRQVFVLASDQKMLNCHVRKGYFVKTTSCDFKARSQSALVFDPWEHSGDVNGIVRSGDSVRLLWSHFKHNFVNNVSIYQLSWFYNHSADVLEDCNMRCRRDIGFLRQTCSRSCERRHSPSVQVSYWLKTWPETDERSRFWIKAYSLTGQPRMDGEPIYDHDYVVLLFDSWPQIRQFHELDFNFV